jgi:hypothetical protein
MSIEMINTIIGMAGLSNEDKCVLIKAASSAATASNATKVSDTSDTVSNAASTVSDVSDLRAIISKMAGAKPVKAVKAIEAVEAVKAIEVVKPVEVVEVVKPISIQSKTKYNTVTSDDMSVILKSQSIELCNMVADSATWKSAGIEPGASDTPYMAYTKGGMMTEMVKSLDAPQRRSINDALANNPTASSLAAKVYATFWSTNHLRGCGGVAKVDFAKNDVQVKYIRWLLFLILADGEVATADLMSYDKLAQSELMKLASDLEETSTAWGAYAADMSPKNAAALIVHAMKEMVWETVFA